MPTSSRSSCAARRAASGLAIVLAVVALAAPWAGATPGRTPPRPATTTSSTIPVPAPPPQSWIVVDMDTGRVLALHDAHVLRRPASTIKLLTVLTAQAHLEADARVPVSAYASTMPALRMGLLPGEVWPLGQLITSTVVVSANDAAVAIAEASGGTLDGFQVQMEDMARTLGMVDAPRLTDPAGLDDNVFHGAGDWISAWDLALVGHAALADPAIVDAAKSPIVKFTDPQGKARRLVNHNELLAKYPGATGLKTGFTNAAGHTLVATATREGRTIMAVALNAPDLYGSITDLLNLGFAIAPGAETGAHLVAPTVAAMSREAVSAVTPASTQMSLVVGGGAGGVAAVAGAALVLRRRAVRRRRTARRAAARPPVAAQRS